MIHHCLRGPLSNAEAAEAAWAAVESGFETWADDHRRDGTWTCADELANRLQIMRVAIRAFEALCELQGTLYNYDVAALVYAACGSEPFNLLDVVVKP